MGRSLDYAWHQCHGLILGGTVEDRPKFEELAAARLAFEQAVEPEAKRQLEIDLDRLRTRLRDATNSGLRDLSDAQLEARIATVRRKIQSAWEGHIDDSFVQHAGGEAGGGFDPVVVRERNDKLDAETGRVELVKELHALFAERDDRLAEASPP